MKRRFTIASLAAGMVLSTVALPAVAQDAETRGVDIACPGGAPDAGFTDVPAANVHSDAIDCGVELEVIFGTSATTYSPARAVTRGQVASLIARALTTAGIELPPVAGSPNFPDAGPPHGDNIRRLAAAGIIEGRNDGTFGTSAPVRRDQLASLYVRALEYVADEELTPDERGYFPDVSDGVHAENVDTAYEFGLMQGKTDGRFDPRGSTRRDQAATVVINFLAILFESELDVVEITLLHDTHFHGKFEGIGEYFALVQERKDALGDNALFLGNGDDVAPSVYSGVFEPHGIHMIEALNAAPIDVNTLANHEFDYGPDNLRDLLEEAEYPYVTANVRDRATGEVFGADLGVEEFITFDVEGVSVGVTGLAPENMTQVTTLGPDTEQIPAADALDIVVPKMRDAGVDIVVVSSHLCGSDAIALADSYEGVDVFAGDHCAVVREEPYVSDNGTIVSLAGDEFSHLAELTLLVDRDDAEIFGFDYTLHTPGELSLTPLASVQAVVDDYDAQLAETDLVDVIGSRQVDWDTRTQVIRSGENALGNYFTDEMRTAFGGSDVAITNSGGLRGNRVYPAGEIVRYEIAEILPFGNTLVQGELTGATLKDALEHSVRLAPAASGAFLQVSGIEFTYDVNLPARTYDSDGNVTNPGSRVLTVAIDGVPLDPTATYTMATNNFMLLNGGDGYHMLRDDATVLVGDGPVLDRFIMEQIEARDGEPITTDIEGRIRSIS